MSNSTLLRSAIAAYCQWAESVHEFDDLYRDDCVLDDIRDSAHVSRNALLGIKPAMEGLFEDVCRAVLDENVSGYTSVYDAGSGLDRETGLPVIRGEFVLDNGYPYPFIIDHAGEFSIRF